MMLKKILLLFSVTIFGIVVSLVIVEIIVRLVPNKQRSWNDRPKYYFTHQNSATLIDYPHGSKAENVYRIGIVGDSYTFAPYMQFTDAFPKVLERMLNLNDGVRKVEVINYGVPGYSTAHEIQSVKDAISRDKVDLILLEVTLNDPEIKPYRPEGIKVFDHFGKINTKGWLSTVFKYWKSLAWVITRIHNQKTVNEYKNYFIDLFENPKTYKSYTSSIKEIIDITKSSNMPLIATVFPLFGLPLDDNYPFHGIHEKAKNPSS